MKRECFFRFFGHGFTAVLVVSLLGACPQSDPSKGPIDVGSDRDTSVSVDQGPDQMSISDVRVEDAPTFDLSQPDLIPDAPSIDFGDNPSLVVAGWNLESGDSNIDFLTPYVTASPEVDIWGFSEVLVSNAGRLRQAALPNGNFRYILGTTGSNDRLLILYNTDRFEELDVEELDDINVTGTARAPLVATFRDRATGQTFRFMVNHLFRTDNAARREQSTLLNQWVATQNDPVIAVGDYNYDWDVDNGENNHDQGYDLLTASNRWRWVRPADLERTQCGSFGNCILDFVFVNSDANQWNGSSEIQTGDPAFCDENGVEQGSTDNGLKSDHKPVWATFYPPVL